MNPIPLLPQVAQIALSHSAFTQLAKDSLGIHPDAPCRATHLGYDSRTGIVTIMLGAIAEAAQ